ncbi:MAG: DUF58 domain-containing protein, partial [Burkholderiales bacterium]
MLSTVRPGQRLIALAAAWLVLGIAAAIAPALAIVWQSAGALLAIAMVTDWLLVRAPMAVTLTREVAGSLPIGVASEVRLKIANQGTRTLALEVYDHHPAKALVEGLPLALALPAGRSAQVRYRFTPLQRGDMRFSGCDVRVASPLRLWEYKRFFAVDSAVRIYPNFAAIMRYTLLATDNRLSQIGILQRRRRGEGLDFHQLREYREGDSQRQIDWNATSRARKLISREYRDERDQQIVFLIDCGRRMSATDADATHLTHFDHVLNAALLLGYVSLRQGDAVGYMTFATAAPRFSAPRKSGATVNLLLNGLYDIQPGLMAPDYYLAAVALSTRVKRRAFVIVLSNLRDEDDDVLAPALRLLRERHLVLFASLREPSLDEALTRPVNSLDTALTHAAAQDYLQARARAMKRIE